MKHSKDKHKEESKETLVKVIASNLFSLGKIFLVCLVLIYFLTNYIAIPVRVYQSSMSPTIKDGTLAIGNAFAGHFMDVERYDIVVAQKKGEAQYIINRVLALPGETIYAKDDVIYVNGEAIEEPYLNTNYVREYRDFGGGFTDDFEPVTLGEDEYFLVGDNRPPSIDSRQLGAFHRDEIKAIGLFVIRSPKR